MLLLLLLFTGIVNGQIVNIPDANFKNFLVSIAEFDTNGDGEIQNSEAETVTGMAISASLNITDLTGIEAFTSLTFLYCNNVELNFLDVSSLSLLERLDCGSSLFTSLNASGLTNLTELAVSNSPISTSGLNIAGSNNIQVFACVNTNVTTLDLSSNSQLISINISFNDNLTYINLKNGHVDANPVLSENPNLAYVCADNDEVEAFSFATSAIVTQYCSFTPGGDYNTITGNILYDPIGDGCDFTGLANPYIGMNINDGVNSGSTICDSAGNYTFYTQSGDFTITPAIENPSYFDISPANAVLNFPAVDNSVQTQNFCMTPTAVAHPDLEIVFIPLDAPIPGSEPRYKIVLRNNGNQTMSGTYSVRYDGDFMTWIAAIPSELQITPEFIIWQFTNLIPFETRIGQLTMRLRNVPLLNPGDTFEFVATINPIPGDETPLNNVSTYTQTAVAVAVANNIECIEGQTMTINEVGAYLHYNVNFRNQALANATNVVVKCIIDPTKFDINSFQLQYASHQVITKVTGNILEIIFKNINLVSVISSPIGGHGNVLFKIKTLPTLVIDDEVLITATIYFDYDLPITTNDARTSIRALTTINFDEDKSIVISPNPAKHNVFVNSKDLIKTIELYDIHGRLLQISYENKTNTILDISNKSNGVYFLKVTTEKGSSVEKLVKEN